MTDVQKLSALQLSWEAVARYLEALLSGLLGRAITCVAKGEDDNYWSVAAVCDTFTNDEILRLVTFVNGDNEMLHCALPDDSNTSKSLDLELCRALLKRALHLVWESEFVSKDYLVLVGRFSPDAQIPAIDRSLIQVDSRVIDLEDLLPMEQFLEQMFNRGGTYSDLTEVCEAYEFKYGNPLYWLHPFTDGQYNGCCFVLVREGVLVISYDVIDEVDHEVFVRESARLCDAEEMRCFLTEWELRTQALTSTMGAFLSYLEREEDRHGA